MKVVTKDEMELIDSETSSLYKFPSCLLMENAGIAIALKIMELYPSITEHRAAVLIGHGNNGGDGLVIARYFFVHKVPVKIYIAAEKDKFKGDALSNLHIAESMEIPIEWIHNCDQWSKSDILSQDYLVDALFGTGLSSELRENYQIYVRDINEKYKGRVLSVDVPSGLLCIEDRQNQCVIRADHTISVGLYKVGMLDYPGKEYCGSLHLVSIGFPENLLCHERLKSNLITGDMVPSIYPKRNANTHKGSYGHLLLICGSKQYSGAALLMAQSAIRTGCGLVTVATVPGVCQTVRGRLPEAICLELPENPDGTISEEAFDRLKELLNTYDALGIGPGLGLNPSTGSFISKVLESYSRPVLIDADGLNWLSQNMDHLNPNNYDNRVITPHIKEMARLTNCTKEDVIANKFRFCRELSERYNVTTVVKSAVTFIATSESEVYINSTGNEGMATGGTGDVLAGMVSSLLAQGLATKESAIIGVYCHGLAGDYAKRYGSSQSLIASDLVRHFDKAFKSFEME